MSAHYFQSGGFRGVIHFADIYRFGGYTFAWHRHLGPTLCRKAGSPAKRQPGKRSKFWIALENWERLTEQERGKTRVYG